MLWQLFSTFAFISLFGFGGGYGFLPLIEEQVIHQHGWLTNAEFMDMLAVAEGTPGPMAINTATYTGFKMAGVPGAFAATFGLILPTFFIIILLSLLLKKNRDNPFIRNAFAGMRPVISALIIATAVKLAISDIQTIWQVLIAIVIFALTMKTKIHPAILLIGLGLLGLVVPF